MIRNATIDDLPALRAFFARANDAPYDLQTVVEEKCFGHGFSGPPLTRVYGDFEGAVVTCGKFVRVLAVDRDERGRGIGTALLHDAEARGASVIGTEAGNYFTPGVFESAAAFFEQRGYTRTAETWNLKTSVGRASARPSEAHRPAHQDRDRVLSFITREFGKIWAFEAGKAFERDDPTIFITTDGDDITGFAAHDVNNRGLGFFGPTGVMKTMRGRGLGCKLLLASLADLSRLGYGEAVIPWTDALDFYRKCCGAVPAHRFVAFGKARP